MRRFILSLSALSLAMPAAMVIPASAAQAHKSKYRHNHAYRGQNARYVQCRHSAGTTGLIAGGVGGAVLGDSVIGHGPLGAIAGGVGGALAGRAIDRSITAKKRCS